MNEEAAGAAQLGGVPSMLDLIRLSRHRLFPPGGRDLYRQIALLTDMAAGDEVLVAACGRGVTLEYFAREYGVHGSGVDEDQVLIEVAEAALRRGEDQGGLEDRVQLQAARMDDLPYRKAVFDVVVGELGLTNRADPEDAIGELVRVLKPGGRIALVQLVWKAPVETERQALLARHLGARPVMLVELKRHLREAGIERLHTEAWSDEETAFRRSAKKPFPDFTDLFGLPEKLVIMRRAWRRWGHRGIFAALARDREVHRLLTKERILGLDMIKGTKRTSPGSEEVGFAERGEVRSTRESAEGLEERDADESRGSQQGETRGLPLFTPGEES